MGLNLLLRSKALDIGFDLVGIAPPDVWEDLRFSRRWVERGFGGEMRYLANPKRDDPRGILPSVKSVICVGLIYNTPYPYSTEVSSRQEAVSRQQESEVRSQKSEARSRQAVVSTQSSVKGHDGQRTRDDWPPRARAWISRYAWGRDYHEVMRPRLERLRQAIEELAPGVETRVFVDTGPVVERAFSRYSGIGWMGKNTCLINEQKGSWFFLGVILTNLALEPDLPAPDRCGSCRACLDACPTGALVEPYVMDASRCISYLTIELKGSIPQEFRPAIGANIFGCDICQDVCPWNSKSGGQFPVVSGEQRPTATTSLPEFHPLDVDLAQSETSPSPPSPLPGEEGGRKPGEGLPRSSPSTFSLFNPSLGDLASITEEDFRRAFRQSPIKRTKYRGWLRNLCVAVGNSGDARFVPKLRELSQHPDAVIREHATWALKRIVRDDH